MPQRTSPDASVAGYCDPAGVLHELHVHRTRAGAWEITDTPTSAPEDTDTRVIETLDGPATAARKPWRWRATTPPATTTPNPAGRRPSPRDHPRRARVRSASCR